MIIRGIVIAALAGISLYSSGILPEFQSKEKEIAIIHTVRQMLDKIHFEPKEINDEFSLKMYDNYLGLIDRNKRFLTKEDIAQLDSYKDKLDDEIKYNKLEFFDLSLDLLNQGIAKTQKYYKEFLDQPFNFEQREEIEMDPEKRDYAVNDEALRDYWRKMLKYEVLTRVNTALEENEQAEEKKTEEQIEQESREKVKEVFDSWYERMDKLRRSDRFELYIDALTHGYDPHSDYFSPKDKQDFDIRMSNKLEGIGARLQADGDYTKVTSLIAGGPAWKGKELEVNDLIIGVAQENEEFVDITGMRLDDVVQLIRGKKGTKVILKVKKKDGTIEEILIERDEVIIEDGKAKSVILHKKGVLDSVGFINLPSFYSDFSDKNGSSCADDIATEIEKLKEENVKGIILDLRFNGGGSLSEVVEMAGFFVEEGPIVQVKPRVNTPYVYADQDDGEVKYDGPLVILVNSFSVSASEILAAAMQDYKRAVIVGSKSTFGKGTVQRFWDMDQAIRGNEEIKPLGEIKITTQKFFRINGGSTQLKGVISDVVLPDLYHYMDSGEKELDNAMPWSKIDKREYDQNVFKINNIAELAKRSQERLQIDPEFNMVEEHATTLKKFRDNTNMPLDLPSYQMLITHREEVENKFDEMLDSEIKDIMVENLTVDLAFIEQDTSRMERNKQWLKALKKDIYTEEAIHVMKDIIELQ